MYEFRFNHIIVECLQVFQRRNLPEAVDAAVINYATIQRYVCITSCHKTIIRMFYNKIRLGDKSTEMSHPYSLHG